MSRPSPKIILTRLVALNAERAAEEAKGTVRWLRPEYQNAGAGARSGGKQAVLDVDDVPAHGLRAWPDELPAQAEALTEVLATLSAPVTVEDIAAHFQGKRTKKRLEEMTKFLEMLQAVGSARRASMLWTTI